MSHIVDLLEKFQPRSKRGRLPAIERRFAKRIAGTWRDLGLHVGRAYNGSAYYQSRFQRFADLALSAVHDDSKVSSRQITNLKRKGGTSVRDNTNRIYRRTGTDQAAGILLL